jgi:hypothetical protein
VTDASVDTLFSDAHTLALYSLWDSSMTATALDDAELGDALDAFGGRFDQIVRVDPETYEVSGAVSLALPIPGDEAIDYVFDETEYAFLVNSTVIGAVNGKLVVGIYAEDNSTLDDFVVFLVFDMASGELISQLILSDVETDLASYLWADQEADIIAAPVTERDGEEFITIRRDDDSAHWYEIGVRSGGLTLLSETYARWCDSDTVSVDYTSLTASGIAEGGCFVEHVDESLFRCDLLLGPNDGSADDTGIQVERELGLD